MTVRRSTTAVVLSLLFLSYACTNSDQRTASPVSPSAIALPSQISTDVRSFTWDCARVVNSTGGWVFAPSTCGANRQMSASAGVGAIGVAPANLRAAVSGNTVRLDWSAVADEVRSYLIEAGSVSGAANLASFNTGTTAPALVVNDVPPGVYFVRVRAVGADGIPGPPSNEITVAVTSACGAPPGAPTALTFSVAGSAVSLSWNGPSGGSAAGGYVLEAGSGPGQSNVVVVDTGTAATQLTATAPIGTYYVRVRARNTCGLSTPSNEVTIGVGTATPTPPTGPTPPRVPPVSPPPVTPVEPVVPGTPPIEAVIPVPPMVTTPAGPAQVQIVSGGRPNAGAGPIISVTVDPSTPLTPRIHVTSPVPFNRAAITIDLPSILPDTRFGSLIVTEAYYDVRLPQAQTTMDVTLTVGTPRSFNVQVAVSANGGGTYGSYASAPVGVTGTAQLFTDRATFLANTSGARTDIDFEGIAAPGVFVHFANVPGGLVLGGVRFDIDPASHTGAVNLDVVNPAATGIRFLYDVGTGSVLTAQPNGIVLRMTLQSDATAIGFEASNGSASQIPGTLRITLGNGQQFTVPLRPFPQIQFVGFVSQGPIGAVNIAMIGQYANYDNVIVTSAR